MFNARELLGQVMQAEMTDTTASRMRHAMGPQGLGESEPARAAARPDRRRRRHAGRSGRHGGEHARRREPLGQKRQSVAVGSLGALAGAVLGGGGGAMKGALGGGVLALLGGIAMAALRNRTGAAAGADQLAKEAPLGLREPQGPAEEAEIEQTARLVLRAMINAAKADGQIDGGEMQRIVGKLEEHGADDEARAFVLGQMQKPANLEGLVADVRSPEVAVQVYGASLLAIEVDTQAERDYLRRLAERLSLDAGTVRRVHAALGVPMSA